MRKSQAVLSSRRALSARRLRGVIRSVGLKSSGIFPQFSLIYSADWGSCITIYCSSNHLMA